MHSLEPKHQSAFAFVEQLMSAGNHEEALRAAESIVLDQLAQAQRARLQFVQGLAYLHLEQPRQALGHLKAAVKESGRHAEYRMALGAALHLLGDLDAAEKQFRECMRLDPSAGNPPYNLGRVLIDKNDLEGAVRAFEFALSKNLNDPEAYAALAEARWLQGDLDAANRTLIQALSINPDNVTACVLLGKIAFQTGDFANAVAAFDRASRVAPKHAEAWFGLSLALANSGDRTNANFVIDRAVNVDRENEEYLYYHAVLNQDANIPTTSSGEERLPDLFVHRKFTPLAAYHARMSIETWSESSTHKLYNLLTSLFVTKAISALSILDLGCGTGTLGRLLNGSAATLIGVDLAPLMIKQAKATRCYTSIEHDEIHRFLNRTPSASTDLVFLGDTTTCIGDLEKLFVEVSRCLTKGGVFALSTFRPPDVTNDMYEISFRPQYHHSEGYIRELAQSHQFNLMGAEHTNFDTLDGMVHAGTNFLFHKE